MTLPARKAFTLVELLIVVSIIMLLMSILAPSLNTAREAARSAVCRMNLHNLGTGMGMYQSQNASDSGLMPSPTRPARACAATSGAPTATRWTGVPARS